MQSSRPKVTLKTLALSYPDLLASKDDIARQFGENISNAMKVRSDTKQILAWHGAQNVYSEIYDTNILFDLLGLKVDYIDIVNARGIERIVDLNEPLPEDLAEQYDIVLDTGTLEHCFNVGQAFKNMAMCPNKGGYIIHAAPLSSFNHGFWSMNPTLYFDFMSDNGYEIHYLRGINGNPSTGYQVIELPAFNRFGSVPDGTSIFCVAERKSIQPIIWPVQRKYRSKIPK